MIESPIKSRLASSTESDEIELFGRKLVGLVNDQIASHQFGDGLQVSISGMLFGLAHTLVAISPTLDHALSGAECFNQDLLDEIKRLWAQQSLERH